MGLDVDGDQLGEGLGAQHLFFAQAELAGCRCHGQAGADALVAAACGAHHREGAAGHAGVRSGGGVRADIIGEGHFLHRAAILQHPAHPHAVVIREAFPGDGVVHGDDFLEEGQLADIRPGDKAINAGDVHIIHAACAGMG